MGEFRNLLYSLAMILYITVQFFLLMKLTFWLQQNVKNFEIELSLFALIITSFLAGILIMMAFNVVFTFISDVMIGEITKLLPDKPYAIWFTRIYSIAFCTILIFQIFSNITNGKTIFVFVVMATVMMRAVWVNIFLTNENLLIKRLSADANMSEKDYRAEIKRAIKQKKAEIETVKRIKKKVYELNRMSDDD